MYMHVTCMLHACYMQGIQRPSKSICRLPALLASRRVSCGCDSGRARRLQERPDYVALRKLFSDVRAEMGPLEVRALGCWAKAGSGERGAGSGERGAGSGSGAKDHSFQFLEGRDLGTAGAVERKRRSSVAPVFPRFRNLGAFGASRSEAAR